MKIKIKRLLPKICIALTLLVSGILWLVNGILEGGSLDFGFNAFWPTVLMGIALAFLVGIFSFNSIGYLYFFVVFGVIGGVFLHAYYNGGFGMIKEHTWPIFVGLPGLASLFMFFARKFSLLHLKCALLFMGVAVLLCLANEGIVKWQIMVPAIVVLIGLIILANVILKKGRSWDMADNEEIGYIPYLDNVSSDDDKKETV